MSSAPRSVGRVLLAPPDPERAPAIDHRPLSDEDGADLRILDAPTEMTGDALREHVRASLGCYFHPVGTCALGSVVDGDGKVRGLNGVHVADCSIMPAIPRANTHLSALAVAELLADRLR